jgi:hypothetical protein
MYRETHHTSSRTEYETIEVLVLLWKRAKRIKRMTCEAALKLPYTFLLIERALSLSVLAAMTKIESTYFSQLDAKKPNIKVPTYSVLGEGPFPGS